MQGLVTCDLQGAGDDSFLYGALLTPKGMIACDMWIARRGPALTLVAPADGYETLVTAFGRFLPPRLARLTDVSPDQSIIRIVGPTASNVATQFGLRLPEPGTIEAVDDLVVARPELGEPFALQIQCPAAARDSLIAELNRCGASSSGLGVLELARVAAGWPLLGAEIDKRTLPQEVRFDELRAVSHSKGCYLGQETVARVHFRGHTNRRLLGLRWDNAPEAEDVNVLLEDKPVGRVSSVISLQHSDLHIGLGVIRREVEAGTEVLAGGATTQILELPFWRDA
jgi:folate-binding protein YgfZ